MTSKAEAFAQVAPILARALARLDNDSSVAACVPRLQPRDTGDRLPVVAGRVAAQAATRVSGPSSPRRPGHPNPSKAHG